MSKAPAQVQSPAARGRPSAVGGQFGAHMSVAGGLENAFRAGREAGCDCLQIFVKNQRQWAAPPLRDETVRAFRAAQRETGIGPVMAHASYLVNLASPDVTIRERSIRAVIDELLRCEALEIGGLVLHPGAHMGQGLDEGIRRASSSLDTIHQGTKGLRVRILLENVAGQGTTLGARFDELWRMMDQVRAPERVGVCLDSCHLFAAGYDLRSPDRFAEMMEEARVIGVLDRVRCIHMNDSKADCGSRVDRHEHIARGRMGRRAFELVVREPCFRDVPKILETPKGVDGRGNDWDVINLRRLRSLVVGHG